VPRTHELHLHFGRPPGNFWRDSWHSFQDCQITIYFLACQDSCQDKHKVFLCAAQNSKKIFGSAEATCPYAISGTVLGILFNIANVINFSGNAKIAFRIGTYRSALGSNSKKIFGSAEATCPYAIPDMILGRVRKF